MPDTKATQAMPGNGEHKGQRDANGETDGLIPRDRRGAGGGGPARPRHADGDYHGGQTGAAYHGYGQLGEDDVEGQQNVNAPSEDP
ncbi:hypothetical protein N0B51_12730 [Tsuneonella sp. YG55]|uniref:Uncharacterized protein n=1 Tax=Tsuneonella litorea TaxID=2976475 RepID=A0A9X2W2F4_9SPHN|nr:hypothetical protein [Tsuneonella litorea]MCT2559842.1 hypothetical protein [Tsuneonella litorea]